MSSELPTSTCLAPSDITPQGRRPDLQEEQNRDTRERERWRGARTRPPLFFPPGPPSHNMPRAAHRPRQPSQNGPCSHHALRPADRGGAYDPIMHRGWGRKKKGAREPRVKEKLGEGNYPFPIMPCTFYHSPVPPDLGRGSPVPSGHRTLAAQAQRKREGGQIGRRRPPALGPRACAARLGFSVRTAQERAASRSLNGRLAVFFSPPPSGGCGVSFVPRMRPPESPGRGGGCEVVQREKSG